MADTTEKKSGEKTTPKTSKKKSSPKKKTVTSSPQKRSGSKKTSVRSTSGVKKTKKTTTAKNTKKKKRAGTAKKQTAKKKSAKKSSAKKTTTKKNPVSKTKKSAGTKSKAKTNKLPVPVKKEKSLAERITGKEIKEIEYTDEESKQRGDAPMSVVGHLDEMRSRILAILGVIIVLTLVAFYFSEPLFDIISAPFKETGLKLNIFKLTGGFIIRIKISAVLSIFAAIPLIVYQIWRYIYPAISTNDRMFSRISLLSAVLLFYGGIFFVFFGLLPMAVKMMISFITPDMLSTIGADDYISFLLLASIAMGILFELPIVMMILTRIGIVTPQFLIRKRKYAIVLIWIIAAVITPQDILSQVLVAVPLMFLYEISILVSRFMIIRKKKRELVKSE